MLYFMHYSQHSFSIVTQFKANKDRQRQRQITEMEKKKKTILCDVVSSTERKTISQHILASFVADYNYNRVTTKGSF